MKRITVAVMVVCVMGLVGGSGSARVSPQAKSSRQESHIYTGSRGDTANVGGHDTNLRDLVFSPAKNERFVHLTADDVHISDELVSLTVSQDIDGDGTAENEYSVCGSSDRPLAVHGGIDIKVHVEVVGCDGTVGGTRGHVDMHFFESKPPATR